MYSKKDLPSCEVQGPGSVFGHKPDPKPVFFVFNEHSRAGKIICLLAKKMHFPSLLFFRMKYLIFIIVCLHACCP